jgi:hypothetical protein
MCWHYRWAWACHDEHPFDWVKQCDDAVQAGTPKGVTYGNADSNRTAQIPLVEKFSHCRAPNCCWEFTGAKKTALLGKKKALSDIRWPSPKELADRVDAVKVAEQEAELVVLYHQRLYRKGQTQDIPVSEGKLGATVPGCEPPEPVDFGLVKSDKS